jgi:hypothetical protein
VRGKALRPQRRLNHRVVPARLAFSNLPQSLLDDSEYTVDVRQNIVIPEAHHTKTLRTQIAISRLVACRL